MYIAIVIDTKTGAGMLTTPCNTRSKAKIEAIKITRGLELDGSFKIVTKSLESFREYLKTE